jgi:hypothetical protein
VKVVSLFFLACGFVCFLIDGHPQATAVIFPFSLSQGFKEAVMRITLFHSFHLVSCSMVYNKRGEFYIYRSQPETEMSCSDGGGDVLYSQTGRRLVKSEMEMSCMAGDGNVLYGLR